MEVIQVARCALPGCTVLRLDLALVPVVASVLQWPVVSVRLGPRLQTERSVLRGSTTLLEEECPAPCGENQCLRWLHVQCVAFIVAPSDLFYVPSSSVFALPLLSCQCCWEGRYRCGRQLQCSVLPKLHQCRREVLPGWCCLLDTLELPARHVQPGRGDRLHTMPHRTIQFAWRRHYGIL